MATNKTEEILGEEKFQSIITKYGLTETEANEIRKILIRWDELNLTIHEPRYNHEKEPEMIRVMAENLGGKSCRSLPMCKAVSDIICEFRDKVCNYK